MSSIKKSRPASTAELSASGGISITMVLFIVFLVLKLTDNIDWSWWWVTSPLWIPLAIVFGVMAIILLIVIIALICGAKLNIKK